MLLRDNVECRVFAELAYTRRNEMSYGNKPNVLAKTVTVMTADCRKVTERPLVKCAIIFPYLKSGILYNKSYLKHKKTGNNNENKQSKHQHQVEERSG